MIKKKDKLKPCTECKSTIVEEDGIIKCSEDKYGEYGRIFSGWDQMSATRLRSELYAASKFMQDTYRTWQYIDDNGNRPAFGCTFNSQANFSISSQTKTYMADPIQVVIAERLLGRPLTPSERIGRGDSPKDEQAVGVEVPLISETGTLYWGFISQIQFPNDVYSRIKPKEVIMGIECEEDPFEWTDMLADYKRYRN